MFASRYSGVLPALAHHDALLECKKAKLTLKRRFNFSFCKAREAPERRIRNGDRRPMRHKPDPDDDEAEDSEDEDE